MANVIPMYKNLKVLTAESVFERLYPVVDNLLRMTQDVHTEVGAAYDALPDKEKKPFRALCEKKWGWSDRYVQRLAQIGREFSHKKELICKGGGVAGDTLDFDVSMKSEIVNVPDDVLKKAVNEGMFDKPVTKQQVRTLRQTGRVPRPKPQKKKTDSEKLMAEIALAAEFMDRAALSINKATAIMEETGIHSPKGKDVSRFTRSFEKLCASVATTLPATSKRAFAILRGEA